MSEDQDNPMAMSQKEASQIKILQFLLIKCVWESK